MDQEHSKKSQKAGELQLSSEELAWRFASGDISPEELALAKKRAVGDPAFKELLLDEIAFESLIALAGSEAADVKQFPWTCAEVRRHANAWRAHELEAISAAGVADHLSGCAACRRALAAPAVGAHGRHRFGLVKTLCASALVLLGAVMGARLFTNDGEVPPVGSSEIPGAQTSPLDGPNSAAAPLPKRHYLLNRYKRPSHIVWPNLSVETLSESIRELRNFSHPFELRPMKAVVRALDADWNQRVEDAIAVDIVFARIGQEVGLDDLDGTNRSLAYFWLAATIHPGLNDIEVNLALRQIERLTRMDSRLLPLTLRLVLNSQSEELIGHGVTRVLDAANKKALPAAFVQEFYTWALMKAHKAGWGLMTKNILAREFQGLFVSPTALKDSIFESPDPEFAQPRAMLARAMLKSGPPSPELLARLYKVAKSLRSDLDRIRLLTIIVAETGDGLALDAITQIAKNTDDPGALGFAREFLNSRPKPNN